MRVLQEAEWRSERAQCSGRAFTPKQTRAEHLPDAEVVIGAQTVAIEVERSAKTPQRLPAILYGLARTYAGIWFFCPTHMLEPMQRAFAQLDPTVRRKFSLVELPSGAGGSGRAANHPAPPTDDEPGRAGGR